MSEDAGNWIQECCDFGISVIRSNRSTSSHPPKLSTFVYPKFPKAVLVNCDPQCCGSGSGIRCLFDPWIRDAGSEIGFFRIPDLGSRIPNPYFSEISDKFLRKKFYNSLKIGSNFILQHFKNKIVKFCEIYDSKNKVWQQFFFTPVFHCCFWIRDPGSEIRDPRWVKIRIRDPG